MATNGNQFDPNDPSNNQGQQNGQGSQQGTPTSQPVNISGSEAQDSSTNSPNQQGQTNPKPTSSGRFQNLNSYLKANQGFNQQNGGLAGQINQNLTSKSNDLQQNFAQAKQDYQTSLNNARQRYDSQFVDNSLQDPTKLSQDDQNKFTQMRDATYNGPTQLDPNLQTQVQDFSNLASGTGTEQGRFNLLQQLYNKPSYTTGQQTLDNLFLQANPTQLANLQNSQITSNQLSSNLGQAQADAGGQAANAIEEANQTQQATRNALMNAVNGFDTQMGQNVQSALTGRDQAYQNELGGLQNGLSSQDALKFGLINNLGDKTSQPIYNLDPTKYLQESTFAPTNQSVASADDYAKINALNSLSGGKLTDPNVSKIFDMYGDPSQAGSFAKQDPYSFNNAQFSNDLNNAKGQYQSALAPQQAAYDAANSTLNSGGQYGGLINQAKATADPIRQNLLQQYNNNKTLGLPNTMGDPSQMSDLDVLRNYGTQPRSNNGNVVGSSNPYDSLIQGITNNQQSMTNSQQMLKQLADTYGLNRSINITDADKYAPVNIANNNPNIDTNNPQGDAVNDTSLPMNALQRIYNR